MSGIYQEIQKRFGESVENYIIASRCAQGLADLSACTEEEKESILQNWALVEAEVAMKKDPRRHSCAKFHDERQSKTKEGADQRRRRKDSVKTGTTTSSSSSSDHRQTLRRIFRSRGDSSPSGEGEKPPRVSTQRYRMNMNMLFDTR